MPQRCPQSMANPSSELSSQARVPQSHSLISIIGAIIGLQTANGSPVGLSKGSVSEKRSISASFLSLLHGTEIGIHGSAEVLRNLFCAAGAFDRAVVRGTVLGPSGVGVHIFLSHAAVHVRLRLLFPFFIEAWIWGNGNEETPAVGNTFADGLWDRLRHHACGWGDGYR